MARLDDILRAEAGGFITPELQADLDRAREFGIIQGEGLKVTIRPKPTTRPQALPTGPEFFEDPQLLQRQAQTRQAAEPIPFNLPPVEPKPSNVNAPQTLGDRVQRSLTLGAQDVGQGGVADVAGFLPDITAMLMNLGLAGAEGGTNLFRDEPISLPRIDNPIGGSRNIAETAAAGVEALGVPLVDRSTLTTGERVMSGINRFASGAVTTGGLATPLATTSRVASALAPKTLKGLAVDTAAGSGAGAAAVGAEEIVPQDHPLSPIASLIASLLGGLTGAKTAQTALAPVQAGRFIRNLFPDPTVPRDPVTGLRPSRRATDKAAEIVQESASDPAKTAEGIEARAQDAAEFFEPTPSSDIATSDVGARIAGQEARKSSAEAAKRFAESDQALQTSAQERIEGFKDPNARPEAAQELVEAAASSRRSTVAEPVTQARGELETLRAENARLLRLQEDNKAGTLATKGKAIAETEIAGKTAQRAEEDLVGTTEGRGDRKNAASKDISEQFNEARSVAKAEKTAAFKNAEDLGKAEVVDGLKLAGVARAVRGDIERLTQPGTSLDVILKELDLLDPPPPKTGETPPAPPVITIRTISQALPQLGRAIKTATANLQGTTAKGLIKIQDAYIAAVDKLAKAGAKGALALQQARKDFGSEGGFAKKFRDEVGGELDAAIRRDKPVKPTEVGERFLGGGEESAKQFSLILGEGGTEAATQFFVADMAKVISSGKINPDRVRAFRESRAGLLSSGSLGKKLKAEVDQLLNDVINKREATTQLHKKLQRQIADRKDAASKLQKNITAAKNRGGVTEKQKLTEIANLEREAVRVERDINNSAAALLMDTEPAIAAGKVFSSNNPAKKMRDIVGDLKGDAEALLGWQEAVVDHMIERVTGTNTALTGGSEIGPVLVGKLKQFFDANVKPLTELFGAKGMSKLRRAHKVLEPLGNLKKIAVGSPEAANAQLFQNMEAGLFATGHSAIAIGMIMRRVKVAIGFLPESAPTRLVALQFFNPQLAVLLLERNVNKIKLPSWNRKLTGLLGAGAFARKVNEPDDEDE